jgi:hypothetical protein
VYLTHFRETLKNRPPPPGAETSEKHIVTGVQRQPSKTDFRHENQGNAKHFGKDAYVSTIKNFLVFRPDLGLNELILNGAIHRPILN